MKKNSFRIVEIIAYLYLLCPIIIFVIGFLKWYWAIIFTAFICIAGYFSLKESSVKGLIIEKKNDQIILWVLLLIIIWVVLSGIGGCSYQNSDHECRTAIFRALVEKDWPVKTIDGTRGLIYYLAFWLPSAVVGKVLGFEAGYKFQVIWAILGIFIVYYLICLYRKKIDILPIIFLIFFSGLDYLGLWILGGTGTNLKEATHIEWWAMDFQYSSTTTQLFWVFNQAIPAWVATMLILNQRTCKNIFFILSTIMLSSTFPFVGLIPISIYCVLNLCIKDKTRFRDIFSVQNIIGVVVIGVITLLYLIGNVSGGMIKSDNLSESIVYEPTAKFIQYLVFYTFEFGIYGFMIYPFNKRNILFYVIIGLLILCPFIKVGEGHDFCMRASIPALLVLMLLCIDAYEKYKKNLNKKKYILFVILLCIGAITPFNEIHRSIRETYFCASQGITVQYPEVDIETELLQFGNFSGECTNSLFFKYLAK